MYIYVEVTADKSKSPLYMMVSVTKLPKVGQMFEVDSRNLLDDQKWDGIIESYGNILVITKIFGTSRRFGLLDPEDLTPKWYEGKLKKEKEKNGKHRG